MANLSYTYTVVQKKSDILFCLLFDNNSPQDNSIEEEVITISFKLSNELLYVSLPQIDPEISLNTKTL